MRIIHFAGSPSQSNAASTTVNTRYEQSSADKAIAEEQKKPYKYKSWGAYELRSYKDEHGISRGYMHELPNPRFDKPKADTLSLSKQSSDPVESTEPPKAEKAAKQKSRRLKELPVLKHLFRLKADKASGKQ